MHSLHPALRFALGVFFYPAALLSVSLVRAPIQVLTGTRVFRRIFEAGLGLNARKRIFWALACLWGALLWAVAWLLRAEMGQPAAVLVWLAALASASCWMRFPRAGVTGYISWDSMPGRVQLHLCTPLGHRRRAMRNDYLALLKEVDASPATAMVFASPLHGQAAALQRQEQHWWRNLEKTRLLARWTLSREQEPRPRSVARTALYLALYGFWTLSRGTKLAFNRDGALPRVLEGVIELTRHPAAR